MYLNQQLAEMLSNCLTYGFKDGEYSYLLNYNITLTNPRNRVPTIPLFGELDFEEIYKNVKDDFELVSYDNKYFEKEYFQPFTQTTITNFLFDLTFINMDGKLNLILTFETQNPFKEELARAIFYYTTLQELLSNKLNLELGVFFLNIPIVKIQQTEFTPEKIIDLEMVPISSPDFEENLTNFDGSEENFLKIFNII